jgi:hypothetical protein
MKMSLFLRNACKKSWIKKMLLKSKKFSVPFFVFNSDFFRSTLPLRHIFLNSAKFFFLQCKISIKFVWERSLYRFALYGSHAAVLKLKYFYIHTISFKLTYIKPHYLSSILSINLCSRTSQPYLLHLWIGFTNISISTLLCFCMYSTIQHGTCTVSTSPSYPPKSSSGWRTL